jgi:alkanesulfonate monooxygenase SsuD/methylene tetrahydromethanopterin reductase-like flavin-dependent oxidoreductase (luciferase family)
LIKPWIFEFCPAFAPPESFAEDYRWYLDLWTRAEAIGFEGIFFSEHHFRPGAMSPSPNLLIASVAARTRTLRVGAMGQVLPLYEPWRVAEEAAMLDQLSGGRFEFGLSSGSGPRETERVGIPPADSRARFAESLEVIDAAMAQAVISHRGRFWNFEGLEISPRPLQKPRPPMWVSGISPESAAMSARRGYKFCTGFLGGSRVRELFEAYHGAAAEAGRADAAENVAVRRQIFIADNDAEGRQVARAGLNAMRALLSGAAHARDVVPDSPARESFISDDECIGGTPANVAEQIIEQCRATGAGHMLAYVFGRLAREQITRCYELWREVIPVLRSARART